MDEFEKRLKRDAEDVETGDATALRARIDASLRATDRIRPVAEARDPGINLWWASSITGLAMAVAVIAVINWNSPVAPEVAPGVVDSTTVPEYVEGIEEMYPLDFKTADFAGPLEDEMLKLRADFERAAETVKEDIEFSF